MEKSGRQQKEEPHQVTSDDDDVNVDIFDELFESSEGRACMQCPKKLEETTEGTGLSTSGAEGWDFSLKKLNIDVKGQPTPIVGAFYENLTGKCFHEMENTFCPDLTKTVKMCRKCHTVFCSKKCFRRSITAFDESQTVEPEGSVESSQQTEKMLTSSASKNQERKDDNGGHGDGFKTTCNRK